MCVMASSSPCCDRSHPGARGDSSAAPTLSTMSSHPAYPHMGSSSTEGPKHCCSFLCSPLDSRYPQLQLSITSESGYPCSGRHSIKQWWSGTWFSWPWCVKTPHGELSRVPWLLSSQLKAVQLWPHASGGFIQSLHIFNTAYSSDTHTLFSVFQVHLNTYALRIYHTIGVTAFLSKRMQQTKSPELHLSIMLT